jgi:AhpD family alkylhydroperoxidase
MARVPLKTRNDLPAELRPLWDKMLGYGSFENQSGVPAHRPPIFKNVWGMLTELAADAQLPKRYLEIALVTVSLLNRCSYCVAHHAPKLEVEGISAPGTETLLEYATHPELDEIDRLVVEYSIAVNDNWTRTGEAIFERLRAHFTDAQIVELTWRIALCGAFNRFSDILQLEVEDGLAGQQAAE